MALNDLKKLVSIISAYEFNFINSTNEIEILCIDSVRQKSLQQILLDELNIKSDDYINSKVRFQINQLTYKLYFNLNEFNLKMFLKDELSLENRFSNDLAILNEYSSPFNGKSIYYECSSKKVFLDFEESKNNFVFSNSYFYLKFLHFLKSQENTEDGFYHFVDHFSWDSGLIVFVSAMKEGKMSISFPDRILNFNVITDLKPKLLRFINAFDITDRNQKMPKFIKAELFNKLAGIPKNDRLFNWVNSMDEILDVAQQNFDIYLSDLSMENIKKDYLIAKDKYLAQLREVVSKLAGQIIGLPISVSAVALATYSIPPGNERESAIWILILVFLIYTFFSLFILKIQADDIDDSKEQYIVEFQKLEKSDFFIKFPTELSDFIYIKDRVMSKINTMRYALYTYILLLIITNSTLIYKLLVEVNTFPVLSVIIFEILLFIFWSSLNKYGRWIATRFIQR